MRDAIEKQLRWDETLSQSTNQEIALAVKQRNDLPSSPFHRTEDGLADFRGFPLKVQLSRMTISDVDFSDSICLLAGSLNNCNVRRSRFSGAKFDGRFVGFLFEDCDFEKVSLKNSALGSASFLNCNFSGANMIDVMARGAPCLTNSTSRSFEDRMARSRGKARCASEMRKEERAKLSRDSEKQVREANRKSWL